MTVEVCAVCAWRETCQKKFSMSGKDVKCPDFTRDVSIGKKETGSAGEKTPGEEERK